METKLKGFQNPKPGLKAAPPPQRGRLTSLSLSARLYGPVLVVKGSASPRFAPWTAPGRAWGLAGFKRERGELQRGGGENPPGTRLRKGAVLQPSGTARARFTSERGHVEYLLAIGTDPSGLYSKSLGRQPPRYLSANSRILSRPSG